MKIKYDVPIKKLSPLPLDGIFSEVIYLESLKEVIEFLKEEKEYYFLGKGTNTLPIVSRVNTPLVIWKNSEILINEKQIIVSGNMAIGEAFQKARENNFSNFIGINTIPGTLRYYYRQRIRYSEDKYGEGKPNLNRPAALVWVQDSKNVTLDNIILYDSMSWTLHIECCENITVKNMVIDDNRHVANSDGVDINASDNVLVDHCFISCADDGIVIKNPIRTGRAMTHVHVKRCTVVTVMNAFKIGTETANDISDILVEDCTFCMPDIYPGSVSGISLESCDGTNLSDVIIRNITMDKIICPLYICLNKRNRYNEPYTDKVGENRYWGGSIKNIRIENIHADNAEVPAILTGYETTRKDGSVVRRPLENITVSSYHVVYRDNEEIVEIPKTFDEFLEDYPESNAHGDVDAYGIWARHIDNLVLEDINVVPRSCNTRKAICLYDVNNKN